MEHRSDTDEQAAENPAVSEREWKEAPDESPPAPSFSSSQAEPTFADTHQRAGFWLRLVAITIDTVILAAFSLLMLILGAAIASMGSEVSELDFEFGGPLSLFLLWLSGVIIAGAAYFTILHSEYGQTIGKSLLRLEVRTPEGEALSYSQALLRWLAYAAAASFFGLGFLWVALTPGKRGWHDLLADTVVVIPKEEAS